MSDTKFKHGDCVILKHSGGDIKMTVDVIFNYQGRLRVTCKFYNKNEGKFEELTVDMDALEKCGD